MTEFEVLDLPGTSVEVRGSVDLDVLTVTAEAGLAHHQGERRGFRHAHLQEIVMRRISPGKRAHGQP